MNRKARFEQVSTLLKAMPENDLRRALAQSTKIYQGITGSSVRMDVEGHTVFVKKIPLSHLEMRAENQMATNNVFNLPLFMHYGIGSPGFGGWRELNAAQMVTQWVAKDDNPNFAMLYHSRVLPVNEVYKISDEQKDNLEKLAEVWEGSEGVRERLEGLYAPAAELILFFEFVPQTLMGWVREQYAHGEENFAHALTMIDQQLSSAIDFMNSEGLWHFDAHFENIQTDGKHLYLNDFGLALAKSFDLNEEERQFLHSHQNYDRARAAVGFCHAVITAVFGEVDWFANLRRAVDSKGAGLSSTVAQVVRKHGPVALVMIDFSHHLTSDSKNTPYPAHHVAAALKGI